jgi:hypothetical protein
MRARTFGLGTVCGLLLAVVAYAVHIHQPPLPMGPDTESEFFKSYNPQPLIERFACGNIVASSSGGKGSSAGVGFVSHQRGITAYIEIDEDHWVPLMQALAADVNKQLLLAGSEGSGEKGKGLASRFYYQDGRSLGSVSIPPLIPYDWFPAGNYPRQSGCSPVLVSVYIDEVFVPKLTLDPADQSARISNRLYRNQHQQ